MLRKRDSKKFEIACIVVAAAIGILVVPYDIEVWKWTQHNPLPGDLRKAVHLSEVFAHAFGVAAILGMLWWIDVRRRKSILKVAAFTALCGVAANVTKYVVPRVRPHSLEDTEHTIDGSWDTWGSPLTGSWFDEAIRSFPSGHSATAVALAIGLSILYPRGKWGFFAIAFVACLQRLIASAHYVSDIMGGILVTFMISLWYWRNFVEIDSANDSPSSAPSTVER